MVPSGAADQSPLYFDIGAYLDGGAVREQPDIGLRTDGRGLFYRGKVNVLFGPPEVGKSWIAAHVVAEALRGEGRVLWIDCDHNGGGSIARRLLNLGVPVDVLRDLDRFRLAVVDEREHLVATVHDATRWGPGVAVFDSIGEIVSMFGASSNSSDEYLEVNRATLAPLAAAGAAAIGLDHEAKGAESRAYGSTGAVAKKSSVSGVMLRVVASQRFRIGVGGTASLAVVKDRPGGVLEYCADTRDEPVAALFKLTPNGDGVRGSLEVPMSHDDVRMAKVDQDVETIMALNPVPTTRRAVWDVLRCSQDQAAIVARRVKVELSAFV